MAREPIRYALCDTDEAAYMYKGHYYKVRKIEGSTVHIYDKDGDANHYPKSFFSRVGYADIAKGDFVRIKGNSSKNVYYVTYSELTRNGIYHVIDEGVSMKENDLDLVYPEEFYVYDKVECVFGSSNIIKGRTYTVYQSSDDEIKVIGVNGDYEWARSERFKKAELKTNNNSAEAHKETIDMTPTTKTATTTNRLMEKFGAFGEVEGVATTMNGSLAFRGEDGNYYSFENNVLVNNEDMVFDFIPGFAIPTPKDKIKEGDLIIQKDGTYVFVNKSLNYVNEKGEVVPTAKTSHALFGNAMEFVSKIMDFNMFSGVQTDNSNIFSNPMMMFMMMGKDGATGGSNDMMKMFMVSQMMNGNQNKDNPMAAMMPMMMLDKSNDNSMMRNMFLFNAMQNMNK